jgi:hypothetical protein
MLKHVMDDLSSVDNGSLANQPETLSPEEAADLS